MKNWIGNDSVEDSQEVPHCREGERWHEGTNAGWQTPTSEYVLPLFLLQSQLFFLPHNIYFTLNVYGPVKFYTCISDRPWATLVFQVVTDRGESSEAGGSFVLTSWCSSSIALTRLVILHAEEINLAKQILLMLTLKTKQNIHLPQTKMYRLNQVFSPTNQKAFKDITVKKDELQ